MREFCREHRLSEPSFYERQTYQERDARRPVAPPAFVPVIVRDEQLAAPEMDLVIELFGGRALRLPGSMAVARVWVATQPVDMRKGFDGLAEVVRAFLGHDPLSGHMFVFRSRSAQRVKVLWYDRDGLAIYYKWLEGGAFRFPSSTM